MSDSPLRVELNGPAPDFTAVTTHGEIRLSTWMPDRWVVLFSHPADFTPVCTTEFVELARRQPEFERAGAALLGLSVDSVYSHIAWARNIAEKLGVVLRFPIIADMDQRIARLYGMIHEAAASSATVRCVYYIDPGRRIRAMECYPLTIGRNVDEMLRVVEALAHADRHGVVCPVNWRPGDPAILPAPTTMQGVDERMADRSVELSDWYLAQKK